MADLVTPMFKEPRKRSPQRQRRADWERELATEQAACAQRSNGWCELPDCDRPGDTFHHKKGRTAPDANQHLLHVCTPHHLEIHSNPAWAYEHGYLMRRTS